MAAWLRGFRKRITEKTEIQECFQGFPTSSLESVGIIRFLVWGHQEENNNLSSEMVIHGMYLTVLSVRPESVSRDVLIPQRVYE